MNYRKLALLTGIATALGGYSASAQTLLVDRGLPTANLNNAAGSDRSNVAWADGEPAGTTPSDPGDSFSLTSAAHVTDIRVWEVGGLTTGLSLLGGNSGSSIGTIDSSYISQLVTYAGGSTTYQTTSGGPLPIYQLDFTVDLSLAAGQTFDFFLSGAPDALNQSPFLHASNQALSGSPQNGSDGTFLFYDPTGSTVDPYNSAGNGWDKNSDGNVQVFGNVPDSGSVLMMLGSSIAGLAWLRRKM